MFETKKTLIVVYKDELLMNQLRKMVETHDDNEQRIVDTKSVSINIVSWKEKVWLGNEKAGNIQGKILFLGEIKGTDKLIPVLDIKFDEYGVRFGWAGNRAVVYVDPKVLTARKVYGAFLEKLFALPIPIPDLLKATKESIPAVESESPVEDAPEPSDSETIEADEKKHKKADIFKGVKKAISTGTDVIGKARTQVTSKSEEVFRNKLLMKRQMLFYGVVSFYNDGLEKFMNM